MQYIKLKWREINIWYFKTHSRDMTRYLAGSPSQSVSNIGRVVDQEGTFYCLSYNVHSPSFYRQCYLNHLPYILNVPSTFLVWIWEVGQHLW